MIKSAISFALGCLFFLQLDLMPSFVYMWLLLALGLVLFLKHTWISCLFLGMAWTFFRADLMINDRLDNDLIGQDIIVQGVISSVVEQQARRLRFEFIPDKSSDHSLPHRLRVNWYYPPSKDVKAGEHWQLTLRAKPPYGMINPNLFDYESWLFQQGIGATAYVRKSASNQRLSTAPFYSINAIRQSLVDFIHTKFTDSPNIGLIQGLITGVRFHISPEQWQVLRLSGTSHLLAISGLHIGLASAMGFFLIRWFWSRRSAHLLYLPAHEAAAIGGFIAALFYTALAGFSIPSQRALIMVSVVMLTLLFRRPINSSSILSISLIAILIHDPLSILSAGFWLSFSAVGIILLISQNRFPAPRWQWLKIPILITIGLSPLLLLFFMQTSLIAPVANLIAIPFVSLLLVPLLLVATAVVWLWQDAALFLFHIADQLINLLWLFLDYLATLPFSHWSGPWLPWYYYSSLIIAGLLLLLPKGTPAKWLGLFAILPLFFYSPNTLKQDEFLLTLLDVGQGLSLVIQTKNHILVFDTGPKFSAQFNTGTAIVKPYLQQQNIKHIDMLVISHGDNDHIGGALPLINSLSVDAIHSSVPEQLPNAMPCLAGQSWQWDGVLFSMLHPHKTDNASENNLSCVLHISSPYGSVLATGDIEKEAEQLLISRYGPALKSTVLIAPHHGSKTSSSEPFIAMVQPELVLYPAAYLNRYHFPAADIVARYQRHNIPQLSTAKQGAIQIKFDQQEGLSPILWRQNMHKIWTQ